MTTSNAIEITIFGKQYKSKDGKSFTKYFTKLTADGASTQVKFREECGNPKTTPCNIVIHKGKVSKATEIYWAKVTNETTGEVTDEKRTRTVLWISEWETGKPYEDHSADDLFITETE